MVLSGLRTTRPEGIAVRSLVMLNCGLFKTMSILLRVSLFAIFLGTDCLAQTGTVTFYSPGISLKSEAEGMLPTKSQQPFDGRLLEGTQKIVQFRHGRFAVFHLNPGTHSFNLRGPEGSDAGPLVIDVENGGQHCIRLFSKMMNLGGFYVEKNQIEEVPCPQAQREAAHLKPIESKRVSTEARSELDPATTFPHDSLTQH